jgi:hypothetical protein
MAPLPPLAAAETDDYDFTHPRELRPADRVRRRLPWLRMTLMSGVVIFALVYLAQQQEPETAGGETGFVPQAVLIAPPPTWQPLAGAAPLYALEGPEGLLPLAFEARRHAGGGREDELRFGSFGEAGYGRVALARDIPEPEARSFYVDLVRRAAFAGLSVARSAQSRPLATKFGTGEAAPVVLAEAAEQACLAFRFAHGEIAFAFTGWICGSDDKPVSEAQLACLIDRLALAKPGEDAALKGLFAQAQSRRDPACAPVARLQSPGRPIKAPTRS